MVDRVVSIYCAAGTDLTISMVEVMDLVGGLSCRDAKAAWAAIGMRGRLTAAEARAALIRAVQSRRDAAIRAMMCSLPE